MMLLEKKASNVTKNGKKPKKVSAITSARKREHRQLIVQRASQLMAPS